MNDSIEIRGKAGEQACGIAPERDPLCADSGGL
jgi:hypothetical protein